MLKARSDDTVLLGLSEQNIRYLTQGMPIKIDMRELGFSAGNVFIFYGKTEDTMKKALLDAGLQLPDQQG